MEYQDHFRFGRIGENLIIRWLHARGNMSLPVYEMETEQPKKGPRIFSIDSQYRAPDILVFNRRNGAFFVEAKRKSHFVWYRKAQAWRTGCDYVCYRDYLEITKQTGLKLWLLFLHEDCRPSAVDLRQGSPEKCPIGLFGQNILKLEETVKNGEWRSGNHNGMVYWNHCDLRLLRSVDDLLTDIHKAELSNPLD